MTVCKKAGPAILRLIFSVYMVAQVKPGLPRVKCRKKAGFSRVKMRKKAGFSRRRRGWHKNAPRRLRGRAGLC